MVTIKKIRVTVLVLILVGTLLLAGCGEKSNPSNQTVEQKQETTSTQEKNEAIEWYNKGNSFYKQNKYSEAIECYDKALEIDPNYTLVWYYKGLAL